MAAATNPLLKPDGTPVDPTLVPPAVTPAMQPAVQPGMNPDGSPISLYQQAATQIAKANTITPVTQTFDESKGVAGRVAQITSMDSPLMQQAKTSGTQLAAARGLTNSSLAGQAEQQAVIAAATPIAQSDATLYQQAQTANQQAQNSAATTNATLNVNAGVTGMQTDAQVQQQKATLDLQAKSLDAQISQFAQSLGVTQADLQLRRDTLTADQQQKLDALNLQKQQLAQQQSQFEAAQTQQIVMQKLGADQATALAQLEAANKEDIQGNINISNAWGSMMQNIQAIQNNANLDGPAKQTLVQNTLDSFASYAQFWKKTSGIDVSDLLNFQQTGAAPNGGAGSQPGVGYPAPGTSGPGVYIPGQPYYPPEQGGSGG